MSQVPLDEPQAVDNEGLTSYFGQEFLDYALNGRKLDEIAYEATFENHARSMLVTIVQGANLQPDPTNRKFHGIFILGAIQATGMNMAQSLHVGNGGAVPEVRSQDPLTRELTKLALAIYPILTLPKAGPDDQLTTSTVISTLLHSYPSHNACILAIAADDDLGALFPGVKGGLPDDRAALYEISMNAIWSTGTGGGLQLVLLPAAILDYTLYWMRINGVDGGHIEDSVADVVALMRKLARDRRASVPVVIGFGNLQVAPGQTVRLTTGRLVSSALLQGIAERVDDGTTSFLILDTELSLLDLLDPNTGDEGEGPPPVARRMEHRRPAIHAAARALDREIVRARLAIALGAPNGKLYGSVITYRWTPNPFLLGGGWGSPARMNPWAENWLVGIEEGTSIAEWSQRLIGLPDSLWLGARRLVGAIAERQDPLDAFIDAVVCWENLFGAEAEVSFRLCAALAVLLEPESPEARAELFKELRDLYGVRSGLVHGSREPSDIKAAQYRARAVELALAAMRALFGHPELLEVGSSSERNRRLLLGA